MREVKARLRALDQIQAPDLRERIRSWEPRAPRTEPSLRRVGIALLAFVVAAAGIAFAVRAFRATESPTRPATTIENGRIAFNSGHIWTVNPDGSELTEVTRDAPTATEYGPQWSPDGSRIAFWAYVDDPVAGGYDLYVMNADGSGMIRLTEGGGDETNAVWSPDGTMLAYVVDNEDGTSEVFVMNADGTGKTRLTDGEHDLSPAWSPDGDRIAFVRSGADYDLYTVRPDGTDLTQLTDFSGFEEMPVWSPDGSMIAFSGSQTGEDELYGINADGTGVAKLTDAPTDRPGCCIGPAAWSPDGTKIVFGVYGEGNWDLYAVNADGTGQTRVTTEPGDEVSPVWAPDGGKIAFLASPMPSSKGDNGGTFDVYAINPDRTDVTRLTQDAGALGGGLSWQPVIITTETVSPTPSPSPSLDAAVAATTTVGADGAVRSVVYGEGAVWVAVTGEPSGAGTVLRIDPETHETIATIAVDAVPGWEVGGAGMTIGAGSVWVTGSVEDPSDPPIGSDAVLVRIDPQSNEVSTTIALGGGTGGDVVVDDSGVWVAVGDKDKGELVRVDPATNEIAARIPIPYKAEPYQDLRGVLAVDGVILVAQLTYENGESAITSVDAATDQVLGTAVLSIGPLVAWNGEVWADNGYQLVRIDPRTGQPLDEIVQLREALAASLLVADERGLWFLGYNGRTGEGPRTLSLFDPEMGEVRTFVDVPGIAPNAMAVGPSSVWVLDYHGTLTLIELA